MKKFLLSIVAVVITASSFGQLTGTKTIGTDYATLAAAITDLNTQGVGAGGVIFNVPGGYTETITAPLSVTATGTAANPIIFQKSGGGANPLITAYAGTNTPASATTDGIWNLVGSDYVTINGIDLTDPNAANPGTMEYGYAMFKASTTDGCQNNTIMNCTVTLNRVNNVAGSGPSLDGSKAIWVANALPASQTTAVVTVDANGSNSNNKFYTNTLQNCNIGIAMAGFADVSPFTYSDQNNDIGGSAGGTGNIIKNYGGGGTATAAAAVRTQNQQNLNISYNTINNNDGGGVNHTTTLRGIYVQDATSANTTITHNTLTIKFGGTTSQVSVIENTSGSTAAGNTVNISDNTIQNCTNDATTSGAWYGIYNNAATPATLTVDNNTFTNNSTKATSGSVYLIRNSGSVSGTINLTNNNLSHTYNGAAAHTATNYYIYNSGGSTSTTLNIDGNDFSNITHNVIGTGTIYFIYNTVSCANLSFSSNTWANLTMNHSGTEYLMYNSSSTQALLNINNNSIVGSYTRTAASGTFYIYYCGSSALGTSIHTYSGNNFSNITSNTAGSGTFYMFYNSDGASSPYPKKQVFNNTFNNITYNTTGSTYLSYFSYLGDGSTSSGSNIYNNTYTNISVGGIVYGLYPGSTVSPTYAPNVYGNTVGNVQSSNASSAVYGCYLAGGAVGLNFFNNNIYGIKSTGTTAIVRGIYALSSVPYNIYNNYISDITAPNSVPTAATTPIVSGLWINTGSTVNIFYNTIYLNAAGTGPFFSTAALYANTTPTLDLRNNILDNNSTPGATGYAVSYWRSSTTLTSYSANSNNNDFFAGTPGVANFIYYDGTNNDQTLAAFKSRVAPRDASSISENPPFVNVAAPPYNLHITPGVQTQCESQGAAVSAPFAINDDFDANPRYPNPGYPDNVSSPATAPDIGADEFAGLFLDATPPTISYLPLMNTSSTSGRTLNATITDGSGVPTSGIGLPVIYWKINAGVWQSTTATHLGGSQYSFVNFGSGVVLGDVVSYYVAAQDGFTPPNVGTNPSAGASGLTPNPPAAATPPTTPNMYTIVGTICGTFNVGAGQTYTTLTAAINDLNSKEMTCAVTFLLTDASYSASETFPIIINQNGGASAVNTLTIKPAPGVTPTITGAVNSSPVIKVYNNYTTIDGSNTVGGTTRDLTVSNTSVTTPQVLVIGSSGTIPVTNCTLKNSTIINGINSSSAVIITDGDSPGSPGYFNNIIVQNNSIQLAYIGLYCNALVTGTNGSGLNITGNDLNTSGANAIRLCPVYVQGVNGVTVSNNNIGNLNTADASNITGIWFATGTANGTISGNTISTIISTTGAPRGIVVSSGLANANINITGNSVTNISTSYSSAPYGIYIFSTTTGVMAMNNAIGGILNSNTGGYGARGLYVNTGLASSNVSLINNLVYDIKCTSDASLTYWCIGIGAEGATGGLNVYHNSVYLSGTYAGYSAATIATAFYAGTAATSMDVRDNIFVNSYDNTASATDKAYAIYCGTTNAAFTNIDNNNYFVSGAPGILGYLGSDIATLPAWQAASGQDGNSVNVDPLFVSPTDLHTTKPELNNGGVFLAAASSDYSNTPRTNPPDIGAYEFTLPMTSINTLAATSIGQTSATMNGDINTNNEVAAMTFDWGLTTGYGSSQAGTPSPVRSLTSTSVSGGLSSLSPNTTYHYRIKGTSATSAEVLNGLDMVFVTLPLPTLSGPTPVCAGSTGNVYTTESGQSGYSWTVSANGTITAGGGIADYTATITWNTAGPGTVSVNYNNSAGNPAPSPTVFNVQVDPVSVGGSIAGSTNVCTGINSTLLTLSGYTGSIVKWQYSTDNWVTPVDIANTTDTYTATNLTTTTKYRAVVQSGVCAAVNSSDATITVDPVSVGGSIAGSTTVCSGTNSTLLTLSGYTGSIVKWQYSTDNWVTPIDIANTNATYTATNLTTTTKFRAVVQSGACSADNSSDATITVDPASVGGSIAGSATVCSGTNSTLLTLSGYTGSIIKWQYSTDNWVTPVDIVNITSTYTATNLTTTTKYRAVVQSGVCPPENSSDATVTVDPVTVGGSVAGSTTVCSGTNSTLLTLSGHTGSVLKWQSSVDNWVTPVDISNTATTLTVNNLTTTTKFRAVVQSGVCAIENSSDATITVDPVSVGGSIAGSATVCAGVNSTLLTLSGYSGTIVKWQYSTDNWVTPVDIVNNTTTYTATNLTVTTKYRAVIQSGVCPVDYSLDATVTVDPVTVGGSIAGSTTVCTGINSTLLTLSGHTGSVLKWQYSTDNWVTPVDIANTTATYTAVNLTVETKYRAVVQSGVCSVENSSDATISVDPASVGGSIAGSATVCAGTNSTLLTLSGYTGTIVKWQYSTDNWATSFDIANTLATYTATNLLVTTQFRAVVQNGVCTPANSSDATVTVNPQPVPLITGPANCIIGTSGNLYNTDPGMTGYVWAISPGNSIDAGQGTDNISVTWSVSGAQWVSVTYTDGNGCNPAAPTVYNVVVLGIPGPAGPITGVTPVCQGQMGVPYSVAPVLNATGYVWTLPAGATIATGSNTNSITVDYSASAVSGNITVYGTNIYGNGATSPPFAVTVNPAPVPVITGTTNACYGSTYTYSTAAGNSNYIWVVTSGSVISGGSLTDNYIIVSWNSGVPPYPGSVSVSYTNSSGCPTLTPTVLNVTVNALPVPLITGNVDPCKGNTETYTTDPAMTNYQWTVSPGASIVGGGGSSQNFVNVQWDFAGARWVNVTYSNGTCSGTTQLPVTVHPTAPTITGPSTACQNSSATYNTDAGNSNYTWTTSAGGVISGGGTSTDDYVNVTWTGAGAQSVTVTYTSAWGCTMSITTFPVTVFPLPVPTITSNIPGPYCIGATVTYTTESGMTGYTWAVSAGGTITGGAGTNIITVLWSGSGAQSVSVNYTNSDLCTAGSPTVLPVTVNPNVGIPVFVLGPASSRCQGAGTVTYTATATDNTGITYALDGVSLAAGNTIDANTGAVTYTAAWNGVSTIIAMATGCNGPTSASHLATTYPTPTVTPVSNVAYCNGTATVPITLSGPVAGTTFAWTNSDPSIGLAASGTGNIPSFTATNPGSTNVVATITVIPTANGCPGPPMNFTITVYPTPNAVATPASQTLCSASPITTIVLSGNVAGTTFNWTRDNNATVTGIAASGSGDISGTLTNTTFAPVTVTFTITPTANGCPGVPITATVLVNPTPNALASPPSQTICSASPITTIILSGSVAGTTFNWTRDNVATVTGIAASGSGDISGTLTNTTFAPVTVTFTITPTANGCPGAPITATVLVNPTPNAVATPASQTICSANPIVTIVLSGSVTGTTFNWTRNNFLTVTGIAASGSGNISGTLTNTSNSPVTVTFTITPTANGCPGAPITATVLVNPTPLVNPVSNVAYCAGSTTAPINFTGPVAGTTFSWTNSNPAIGLAASGNGNIPSFTATNPGSTPISGTIVVTPSANSCTGPTMSFTITVNPLPVPTITGPATVCAPQAGNVYTTQAGMTGYIWTVGAGGTITSGAGTNSITVSWNSAGNWQVCVNYTNTYGCTAVTPTCYAVTVNPRPIPTLAGPNPVCAGATGNVYTTEAGMTNYVWTVSAGGTITGGGTSTSNTVTVTWNTAGAQSVSVNYTNASGCSATAPTVFNVTVNPLPVPTITGPNPVCAGSTGNVYSSQTGMTNYVWTVSAGGTITGGSGTSSITVTWNTAGAQSVSLVYTNANGCTNTTPAVFNVTVNALPVPTITGYASMCVGVTPLLYTTESGMTNYVWTVSPGNTITSGQGTNQAWVAWTASGAQWVAVTYTNANGCTANPPTQLNVLVDPLPDPAGTITGTSVVCGGATGVAYSVGAIANATNYVWLLPPGATIATGAGTNSITVDFDPFAQSGDITVFGNNLCGNGASSPPFAVTVNALPDTAGVIMGESVVCQGTTGVIYSVEPIANATGYVWTVPAGATIVAGANTNAITVDFNLVAVSGVITVYGTNSCGNGEMGPEFEVTVNPIPPTPIITELPGPILHSNVPTGNQWYFQGTPIPGATDQDYAPEQSGEYWCVVTWNGCSSDTSNHIWIVMPGIQPGQGAAKFVVYPVPNDGRFKASITYPKTGTFNIRIYNNLGVMIYEMADIEVNGTAERSFDLRPAPSGIYSVVFENQDNRVIRKILINR